MVRVFALLAVLLPLPLAVYLRFFEPSWQLENLAAFLSLFTIYFGLLALIFLMMRHWLVFTGLLLTVLLFTLGMSNISINQSACATNRLSVLQYNVFFDNPSLSSLIDYVNQAQPDMVVLQEVSPRHGQALEALFRSYPYYYGGQIRVGYPSGQMVLSKTPLYGMTTHRTTAGHAFISFVWQTRFEQDVMVIAAHPPSPRNQKHWNERNDMLAEIETLALRSPLTFNLVVGDFNLASTTRRFDKFLPMFHTAPIHSWPVFLKRWHLPTYPIVAIDHLWVSNENSDRSPICQRKRVMEITGSDHAAVMTVLNVD
jgi:endonuclease/exonuclease/phosphatase (EEP) superfamily protein YafD